jgi:hypothetical protein
MAKIETQGRTSQGVRRREPTPLRWSEGRRAAEARELLEAVTVAGRLAVEPGVGSKALAWSRHPDDDIRSGA